MIVEEATYEVTDPTVDSQIVTLQGSGADTFINITTPKFAAQAIRKAYDIGWKPLHILNNVCASVGSVLTPAGSRRRSARSPSPTTRTRTTRSGRTTRRCSSGAPSWGATTATATRRTRATSTATRARRSMMQMLKQCGNDLTRENVMKQAANLKHFKLPLLLPGMKINTSPTDFFPSSRCSWRSSPARSGSCSAS